MGLRMLLSYPIQMKRPLPKELPVRVNPRVQQVPCKPLKTPRVEQDFLWAYFYIDISLVEKFEVQPELNFIAIKDNLNQIQAPF